jgi:hypothetical protein
MLYILFSGGENEVAINLIVQHVQTQLTARGFKLRSDYPLFIHSFIHPFIHPFIHSFIHSFEHISLQGVASLVQSIHPFIHYTIHLRR